MISRYIGLSERLLHHNMTMQNEMLEGENAVILGESVRDDAAFAMGRARNG